MIRPQINAFRAQHGLDALRSHLVMTAIATRHARAMRRAGYAFHRKHPEQGLPRGWTLYGENVGYTVRVNRIVPAWIRSPTHRSVMLGSFTHVGIGTATDRFGFVYVAACFVELP